MAKFRTNQGAKAFLLRDGQVLVLLKQNGQWDLPGGRKGENESCLDCLRREIHEETRLEDVEISILFASWSFVKESGLRVYGTTWFCAFVSGEIVLSLEHSRFSWVPVDELKDMEIYQKYGLDKFLFDSKMLSPERRKSHGRRLH